MKTKFDWVALLASAALIAQAKAGGDHGMRVTGSLTNDTLDALGLPPVASN
jgi:hypothetical protein